MTVDYIEYRTTHKNGNVTYSQATQAVLGAPDTAVKVEQITNYTNGSVQVFNRPFIKAEAFVCPIDPQERLNCESCQ